MTEKEILELLSKSYKNALVSAKSHQQRKWIEDRKLVPQLIGLGYHSGQVHHRKSREFKAYLEQVGLLSESEKKDRVGNKAYDNLCTRSFSFELRNRDGDLVNFFFKHLTGNKSVYLNHKGVYPYYPHPKTTRLYVAEDELSAATILSAGILQNQESVIALRRGKFTDDIEDAISSLNQLKHINLIE